VECHLAAQELAGRYADLIKAHEATIAICATTHGGSAAHRMAHSSGLVTYLNAWGTDEESDPDADPEEAANNAAEKVLRARMDIPHTEIERLIRARVGQGVFRANVLGVESGCRVTGVTDPDHLRASHIKP
jgi:hypothetical protein